MNSSPCFNKQTVKEKKRCAIFCGGALKGAYGAGVASTLIKELGSDYFHEIRCCSVGFFVSLFYVSGQPDVMEHVWRELVDSGKLFSFRKIFKGRWPLDLKYLIGIFKIPGPSYLNAEAVLASPVKLIVPLADSRTGENIYRTPQSIEEIYHFMKIAGAVPFVHGAVRYNGKKYFDGGLTDPIPIPSELDEYSEILIVANKPLNVKDYQGMWSNKFFSLAFKLTPLYARLIGQYRDRINEVERLIAEDSRIRIICPNQPLAFQSIFDSRKEVINASFDIGVRDTKSYLQAQ